jgi:hypothetical protein
VTGSDSSQGRHDAFEELAAIATSGTLTIREMQELTDHLQNCAECREVYREYLFLASHASTVLAAKYEDREATENWDDTSVRRKLFRRIRQTSEQNVPARVSRYVSRVRWNRPGIVRAALAAGLAVSLLIGTGAYYLGTWREMQARTKEASTESLLKQLLSTRNSAGALLTVQAEKIAQLQTESSAKSRAEENLRAQLRTLRDVLEQDHASGQEALKGLEKARAVHDEQVHAASVEQDRLIEQVNGLKEALQRARAEVTTVSAQRDEATLRAATLDTEMNELTIAKREQQRRLEESAKYLSSDRDIRELMSARNLYITDVFDVDSKSQTRKPFGRVFYTRGKSLIFYAFDLDRARNAGTDDASAFQVWGHKEKPQDENARPRSLGILYLDSASNRRWTLTLDDPRTLAQIDAVFVTVEPHGGSREPTGKPFLFAQLQKPANHP